MSYGVYCTLARALPALSRAARAQIYLSRPVHLVVGFAAKRSTPWRV
jgi:hypothetical protein